MLPVAPSTSAHRASGRTPDSGRRRKKVTHHIASAVFLHFFFVGGNNCGRLPHSSQAFHPQLAGRFGRNMHDGTASFEHER